VALEERTDLPVLSRGGIGYIFDWWDALRKKHPFATGLLARIVVSVLLDKVFDNVLYPLAQAKWGIAGGTAVMTVASALICLVFLFHYDHHKDDTWGLEEEKKIIKKLGGVDISEKVHQSKLSALLALLVLPIATDPFTALARIRRKDDYSMNTEYWMFFTTAMLLANIGWGAWVAFFVWALITIVSFTETTGQSFFIIVMTVGVVSILYCPIPKPNKKKEDEKMSEGT
jgi:hypothetical protein